MTQEYLDVYHRYTKRFEERYGEVAVGQPVMSEGKLVQKLSLDEFSAKWRLFRETETFLRDSMSRGHTLSDAVEHQYRDLCAEVLEKPKDFKLI